VPVPDLLINENQILSPQNQLFIHERYILGVCHVDFPIKPH